MSDMLLLPYLCLQDTELRDTDSALVLLPTTAGCSRLPPDACHSW
jgi:hypothetical protein